VTHCHSLRGKSRRPFSGKIRGRENSTFAVIGVHEGEGASRGRSRKKPATSRLRWNKSFGEASHAPLAKVWDIEEKNNNGGKRKGK